MKRILYILSFLLAFNLGAVAQEEGGEKVRERMQEYIQKRLGLSKDEAQKFSPIFLEYFRELRKTNQQFRTDKILLQQKIAEVRLKYRDQFKPVIGEKRSNDVFVHEGEFIREAKKVHTERILENRRGGRAKDNL
jgi:hypothetical protein